jgi:hypothetical protein
MTKTDEWIERLLELKAAGAGELSGLAEQMAGDVRGPGEALGRALVGGDPEVIGAAKFTLLELGPAALEGLLSCPLPKDPDERAWLIDRLVEAELQVRARVRARIMGLLEDPAWMRDPRDGPELEVYPPRERVCDHAYVSMRALTHPEEDQVGFGVETSQFLHMPAELKDQEIAQAKTCHVWNHPPPDPEDL